jgi:hypothetical protein
MVSIKKRPTSAKSKVGHDGGGRRMPSFRSKLNVGGTGVRGRPDEQSPPAEQKVVGPQLLASWLRLFHPEARPVIEMRILKIKDEGRSYPYNVGGYFDAEHFSGAAARALDRKTAEGAYFTLNPLRNGVEARCPNKLKRAEPGGLTSKDDVDKRQWLMIDADPKRPGGVSATKAERDKAWNDIGQLRDYLKGQGWPEPIVASSGNGFHLYYRVDLPADDGGLVERVLKELSQRFSTADTKIDPTTHKPNQLTKLYGTYARKGEDTPDRPHRRSHLTEVPGCESVWDVSTADVKVVTKEQLEAVGGAAPPVNGRAGAASKGRHSDHRLMVPTYLAHFGVSVRKEVKPGVWQIECPFDSSHGTKGETVVGQFPNGATYFKCNHPDCDGKKWAEFKRVVGEPLPEHYDPPKGRRAARPRPQGQREGVGGTGVCGTVATSQDGDGGDPREPPEVCLDDEEFVAIKGAAKALGDNPMKYAIDPVYRRGDILVRILRDDEGRPAIKELPRALLSQHLTARARFTRGGEEVGRPSKEFLDAVFALGDWPEVPKIAGVIEYPVMRPDGTILALPGYDKETGMLFESHGAVPVVPDEPTRADATRACDELLDLVADFPFEKPVHRACWLAALLTGLARFAFDGPSPLFLADANVRGVGKGLLLDCLGVILTGDVFPVMAYTNDEKELEKRVTALAIQGSRFVLFDNVSGRFGNSVLDAALTKDIWEGRLLCHNRTVTAPLRPLWMATGNNLHTGRRVCPIRLETDREHPEERDDFRHPDLMAHVREWRVALLEDALLLLRAYHVAGRPPQGLKTWGSFGGWSALVRGAVRWLGLPDPYEACADMQDQADTTAADMAVLLRCWETMDPEGRGMTASEVVERLRSVPLEEAGEWQHDMRAAVEGLAGWGTETSARLGYKLRSNRRRRFDGRYIDAAGKSHGAALWTVHGGQKSGTTQTEMKFGGEDGGEDEGA